MKLYESEELLEITRSEKPKYTADFSKYLYGDTIASVVSVTQVLNTGLTLGTPGINTDGPIDVEGVSIAQNKAVQLFIDARPNPPSYPAGAGLGSAKIRIVIQTADGNILGVDCRLMVYA